MPKVAKSVEFRSQQYLPYWPAVLVSDKVQEHLNSYSVQYGGFTAAFNKLVLALLEEARNRQVGPKKIQIAEVPPEDDVPTGIRISYDFGPEGLMICGIITPLQPALFGF